MTRPKDPFYHYDAIRTLAFGMWVRDFYATRPVFNSYVEAAHVALREFGCVVPTSPWGLRLLVSEAVVAAGPVPPETTLMDVLAWRERLTEDIIDELFP